MKPLATIGLDIAKQVFQVHGADKVGRAVLRRKLRRSEVTRFFSELTPRLVGIEASGSAHYWARAIGGLGHTVRLMAPQFVKPYVKSQKNDANDTEAICEAVTRPHMRFVPQKSVEQHDLQCLHLVRSRLVGCRTQLINQIRGLLAEYGIVLPQHPGQVRRGLPAVLEDAENQLTGASRELFRSLYEELAELDEKIAAADNRIKFAFQNTPNCQRIAAVEGVEPLIALKKRPQKRRKAVRHREARFQPTAPNEAWSIDFVADQLQDGRRFRSLTVVDVFTRESVAIEVGQSLRGEDVVRTMNRLKQQGRTPNPFTGVAIKSHNRFRKIPAIKLSLRPLSQVGDHIRQSESIWVCAFGEPKWLSRAGAVGLYDVESSGFVFHYSGASQLTSKRPKCESLLMGLRVDFRTCEGHYGGNK